MVFLFVSFYISSKEGEGRREDKTPGLIFGSFSKLGPCFSIVFAFASVVEAAPQARPKTTAVANTALGPFPCSPPSLNALPVPVLRQVSKKSVSDLQKLSNCQEKDNDFNKLAVAR